jgi:hypothetical protein
MPIEATNELFYLYALVLSIGETINGTLVKAKTIRDYLGAAANYVRLIGQRSCCPMTDPKTGKIFDKIDKHIQAFGRWQNMPNRQDPLTKKMIRTLQEYVLEQDMHPDSKEQAFIDWCIIGLHMGHQRCEWASEKMHDNPDNATRAGDPAKSIYQCLLDDLTLLDENGTRIRDPISFPENKLGGSIHRVRFQKNGQHGQKVKQSANHKDPLFCCARAVQRIHKRAQRLGLEGHQPACSFRQNKKSKRPSFFHKSSVNTMLRNMAKRTYKVQNLKEEGLQYTGHSIRVGATVLLYCGGASDVQIQHRLRWRSLSFLDYLRDMPRSAINHMNVINASDVESWIQ